MEPLSSLIGQAVITLITTGLIALVATVFKMSGRMSRVEGKLEMLITMVGNALGDKPANAGRSQHRYQPKGAKRRE